MNKKPNRYVIHLVIISIALVIGVPLFLISYDVISNALQSVVKVKTGSSFSGGDVAAVFYDPVGDDNGFGALAYPQDIHAGTLDLMRYTVRRPVRFSRAVGLRSFWQLDFSFRSAGPGRNIKVYFGLSDSEKGSTTTRTEFAENVEFSPQAPWQFVVSIKDDAGTIESFDRSFKRDIQVFQSQSGKDVYARISLKGPQLQILRTRPECYHYVMVGALDLDGRDGFADMTDSDFVPKLYDILVPDGVSQKELLSAWDEDSFIIPIMQPVQVNLAGRPEGKNAGKSVSDETVARLAELEKAAADEAALMESNAFALYSSKPSNRLDHAIAAFDADKLLEAETLFNEILATNKNSIPAISYTGALIALRASVAPPLEAIGIIKEAYVWLDRAVSLAVTQNDLLYAYMNRGHVSLAIPNTIFGMAAQGGDDFIRASESVQSLIANDTVTTDVSGETLISTITKAARCYEIAGETNKAETWYREARRLLETFPAQSCAQERLIVFKYFEIGPMNVVDSVNSDKKENAKNVKNSAKEQEKKAAAELERLLADLEKGPVTVEKISVILKIQIMQLDRVEDGLRLAGQYKELIVDSQDAQLLVAVGECKMAGIVKKTIEKVDWVNTGMRRFEKIQRQWPNNENVYLFQTLTYSNFPSELGMIDSVLDLLSQITGYYQKGSWNINDAPVDLIWDIWINLGKNYPRKTEQVSIQNQAKKMTDILPVMKKSEKAGEVLYE